MLPLDKIKYILGPQNYSEYDYNGINICIFGENHQLRMHGKCQFSKNDTVYFHNFLQTVLEANKDKFYDFFVELPYTNADLPAQPWVHKINFSLHYIADAFRGCLSLEKMCRYNNLRAHYSDPRDFVLPLFKKIADTNHIPPNYDIHMFKKSVVTILKSNIILRKELRKSYLGKEIEKFARSEIEREYANITGDFVDDVISVCTPIMDAYALARMFRKFKPSSDKPSEMSNIIVYAGDIHSKNYERFIEKYLGLKPKIKTRQKYDDALKSSCLNVSKFKHASSLFS